jgi:hypothetical protein
MKCGMVGEILPMAADGDLLIRDYGYGPADGPPVGAGILAAFVAGSALFWLVSLATSFAIGYWLGSC